MMAAWRLIVVAALTALAAACESQVEGGRLDAMAPEAGRDAGTPRSDSAVIRDSSAMDAEAECAPGVPGCTCVTEPRDPEGACTHSFGGRYSDGACSGSYQCCGGDWRSGQGSCGPCTCVDASGTSGCIPEADARTHCFAAFEGSARPLPPDVRELMTGTSYRPGCPLDLESLSLLDMTHWGFDGEVRRGRMVVAAAVADDILSVFRQLYDARFPIDKIRLIDHYDADDDRSMADNNTSAFNCRPITGGESWSQHSYGDAIDINPVQNPYVSGSTVLPPAGAAYTNRDDTRPGMIVDPGPVIAAFAGIGWEWGGHWSTVKDYQHFSENGR